MMSAFVYNYKCTRLILECKYFNHRVRYIILTNSTSSIIHVSVM